MDMLRYEGSGQRGLESRSSDLLVSPSFVEVQDEINKTSRSRFNDFLISPSRSAINLRPVDTLVTSANSTSTTSSNPNSASSNWSEFPFGYNGSSSSQTCPPSALNAGNCIKERSFAFSTASSSNMDQNKTLPSASICFLCSKQSSPNKKSSRGIFKILIINWI
ncbi:PREDICTED: uncharacterized protein LOC108773706 [Cyphomyrmex costatus]|uniref:uncharacterized protein LOC108773706 n=1 Tax=Cyphomyrmex costatus TaxID=456900 RepID=UPI0008521D13|nr:PREDICTED: uncharacterized protein LOC108773706 [Cyphomyrmex costatus]